MKEFILLSLIVILFSECRYPNKNKQKDIDSSNLGASISSAGSDSLNSNISPNPKDDSIINSYKTSDKKNVIYSSEIKPFGMVDTLVKLFEKDNNVAHLTKVDSISCQSDGELTEKLDNVCLELLNKSTVGFVNYLINKPHSCLLNRLIESLGEEYSEYDKKMRPQKLLAYRDSLISKGKLNGLSNAEVTFLKSIFSKVDPNILD